jgi:hypothetical protein
MNRAGHRQLTSHSQNYELLTRRENANADRQAISSVKRGQRSSRTMSPWAAGRGSAFSSVAILSASVLAPGNLVLPCRAVVLLMRGRSPL